MNTIQIIKRMYYPVDLKMEYLDTAGYRSCLRQLFKMNPNNYIINTNNEYDIHSMDDESIDELSYDETAASGILDYIYEKTRDNILFQKLYQLSAGLMFSTDHEIGVSVLFSYDYLADFHKCLVAFLKDPNEFTIDTPYYSTLVKKLS